MTQTHAVIGTAQYLSPEQARGETVDARSDLYSTGCLLFELLTGRPPFIGDSPVAVAYQHVGQAPQRPSELASDVPEVLDRIVLKSLAKDRDARYSTAAEFRADLETALRGGDVTAPLIGAAAAGAAATQVMGQPASTQVMDPASTSQWGTTGVQGANGGEPDDEKKSRKGLMWALIAIGAVALAAIITFIVMNGANATTIVPELKSNVTPAEAEREITAAGLEYEQATDTESTEPENTFLGTDPQGGAEVERGSVVTVTFSAGPDTVAVPKLAGMTQDEAEAALEDAKLTLGKVSDANSKDVEEGQVIESKPGAGQAVSEGSPVGLVLSNGRVELPNLKGKSEQTAKDMLTGLGLSSSSTTEESDEKPGTVIRQSPEAGNVEQHSSVELVIAKEKAPEMTTVPPVVGSSAAEAQAAIKAANLTPQITFEPSDDVANGFVISQDPESGEVEVGSDVTVVVSSGPEAEETPTGDPSGPATDGETDDSGGLPGLDLGGDS